MTKSSIHLQARVFASLLLLIHLLAPGCVYAQRNTRRQTDAPLAWPQVTKQMKPWTRWWWHGSIVNQKDLTTELEKYRQAGLGGVEITPIYGVKGDENRFIKFLSPQWMEMLEHSLREAARLGIGVDMATGTGWPFGGPWVGDADAPKYFVHKKYELKSGERLNEPVAYVQRSLLRAVGRHAHTSEIKDPVSANENLQALALDQVRFKKPLPLQALMAYSSKDETLNLTDKVDANGKLNWIAPAGDWTLYALFQGWHGKMVERAAPGGEGNVIDHFSAGALKNYLEKFDAAFAGRDAKLLRAFFNDSYEVDDAEGDANWTANFFDEFRARRGYDLREHLPALAGQTSAEKDARILYDFRETISDLLLEEFTITWRRWAAGRGAVVRNQAHGSPANILDLYAASDIPETEGTDIVRMKFASSAANVTGKTLASAEAATWLNEHFTSTLGDVKNAVDLYFLGGINHVVYHGTPFSPSSEEWPGRLFYAAVHFGPTNSFWNDFSALNEYIARTQSFLQAGRADNDVLLYYPIHDRWSERGKEMMIHVGGGHDSGITLDDAQEMLNNGYTFDLISDRQLADVSFTGNSLRAGGLSYKVVVLPESRFIPLRTFEKLVELARQGATIITVKNLPSDVPGWGNLARRRNTLRQSVARLRFERTDDAGIERANMASGRFLRGDDLKRMLSVAGVRRETMTDHGLQFVRRKHGTGNFYFILNPSDKPLDNWVPLQTSAKSVAIFDPMREEAGLASLRATAGGGQE
ncbi:MAG TPA: glycosyl hydrolase, partial [Pyrinomonadaceae bacterium]|nr:glycosyl hydrolase [Pyrinomonadaceae bacterium]